MRKLACLLIIVFSLLLGQIVQAVGVGVRPKEINLEVKTGQEVITEFLVVNVAEVPAIYQVYPDGLENQIQIDPTDFRLETGANQIVTLKIKIKTPGLFSTNISVIARPLAISSFAAASGVKLSITIKASGVPFSWLIWGLLIVCLGVIFAVLLIKRRKKVENIHKPKLI